MQISQRFIDEARALLEHHIVVEDRLVAFLSVGELVWTLIELETCQLREADGQYA